MIDWKCGGTERTMNTKLTINEKITDLRVQAGLSQKELCAAIGIPASSLSRIERGEITNVSNDILVKLAKYFRVSTDYLLGMTKVTTAKNVELEELGLSNKALLLLLAGKVDGALLSRLIEHPRFALLLDASEAYFKDDHKEGLQSRNDIINLATASLKDIAKDYPEKKNEIAGNVRRLNLEKISGEEADLNKLRNIFLSMVKDIKADYRSAPEDISRKEFKEQLTEIKSQSDQIQLTRKVSETEMADIVTSVLTGSGMADLDETETQMFHELFRHILERMGKEKSKNLKRP